jgi:hypothetical protein
MWWLMGEGIAHPKDDRSFERLMLIIDDVVAHKKGDVSLVM